MRLSPDKWVDLIMNNPPFAIDFRARRANYNRISERVLEGYNEIRAEAYYDFTLSWTREAYRVLKPSRRETSQC